MFSSYIARSHSWMLVEGIKYAISFSHTLQMRIQLNTWEDLKNNNTAGFFMNFNDSDYRSIKALKTTFASLPRSALPHKSTIFTLNIGLVRSTQSENAQATSNDMKDCSSQCVNEFETGPALALRGQGNSEIFEYRLTSELPDEYTLEVLQNNFEAKMGRRGFIWPAVQLRNSFELLTQLYLRMLRWTEITIEGNTVVMEVPYLSQYASVFFVP